MAGSGSFARGDQPRSVPDLDRNAHEAAAQWQRGYNAKQAAAQQARSQRGGQAASRTPVRREPDLEHSLPDATAAHLTKVFGFARDARKKWVQGDKVEAALDTSFGLADASVGGAPVKATWKIVGPKVWHTAPWESAGVRRWMKDSGLIGLKEQGHHAYIPQGGWGKYVPDFVKNQPWNIKALDPVTHRRVHSRARIEGEWLPRFDGLERFWHGTTPFAKALFAGAILDAPEPSGVTPIPRKSAPPTSTRSKPEPHQ